MSDLRNKLQFINFSSVITLFLIFVLLFSCEKIEPKRVLKVETGSISDISFSSCFIQGNILDKGEGAIVQHGFCWDETQNPTTINPDNTILLGSKNSTGIFTGDITGLSGNTTYHVRAYATNSSGTSYGTDQFFTTSAPLSEAEINDTLILCYSLLEEYVQLTYLFDAVYANNIPSPGGTWDFIFQHSQNANNQLVLLLWSNAYDIIFKTNFILNNTASVIADQEARNLINAQAKTIRAYLLHNLMIWFGDIPLESGISPSLIGRNTITEVLAQIQMDTEDAYQDLPEEWLAADEFRIPRTFARGIQTRVALHKNDWANTAVYADEIINDVTYTLSSDTNNFTSTNSEIFWGFNKGGNTEFNDFFTKGSFVPVIRLTETFLSRAEAYANSGDLSDALQITNMLKSRRDDATLPNYSTQSEALNDIFLHWKEELVKEGIMFATLKRFNEALSTLTIDSSKLLLPLPQTALDINPNLTQNPGY